MALCVEIHMYVRHLLKKHFQFMSAGLKISPEHEFVNVWGAQESIPPACVACRAGKITLFAVLARQATLAGGVDSEAP